MKLGTETGSLINHVQSHVVKNQPIPFVGMGVTILHWTDRSAGTIVKIETIKNQLYVHVQEDHAKRMDNRGMSESQEYEYTPNPNAGIFTWRLKPNGMWEGAWFNNKTKRWNKSVGDGLSIGRRESYHDYSF